MIRHLLLLAITAQPLVNPDVLEPSVLNEVVHALSLAPTNAILCGYSFTNGVTATDRAIAIVSAQRSDGRWFIGTNDVTSAALRQLRILADLPEIGE